MLEMPTISKKKMTITKLKRDVLMQRDKARKRSDRAAKEIDIR